MTTAHYSKLWTIVGLALVFYSLNAWIASQGGQPFLSAKLLEDRPVLSALLAIPICGALLALLCEIGIRYARGSGASGWHARLPVVGLDGLKTGSREGRAYQGFFLTLFVIIPSGALIHFINKSSAAKVVVNDATRREVSIVHFPDAPLSWSTWDDGFRIGQSIPPPGKPLEDMVTWLPVLEPLVFVLLVVLAFWRALVLLREILR